MLRTLLFTTQPHSSAARNRRSNLCGQNSFLIHICVLTYAYVHPRQIWCREITNDALAPVFATRACMKRGPRQSSHGSPVPSHYRTEVFVTRMDSKRASCASALFRNLITPECDKTAPLRTKGWYLKAYLSKEVPLSGSNRYTGCSKFAFSRH